MDTIARQARARAIKRTSVVGAVINLLLSAIKIAAGWMGQSHALIADGVHSLSDLLSDVLVWFAGHKAAKGPDAEHPYGHGRFETVATLVLGFLLSAVAIGIAWDATERLFQPEALLRPEPIALYAAGLSILVKEVLYWYTRAYGLRVRSDLLMANAWHHRSDAISSIVVLIGVAGTLAGLPYLDSVASVIVAVMIAKIAWDLGSDATRELVDTGLSPERLREISQIIRRSTGVRDVHMLRTRTLGGNASADVHVLVDPDISVSEGHAISMLVQERLMEAIDRMSDVTVHIDPEDDETAAPTKGLPLRTEVIERLDQLWGQIPEALMRKRVVLHYLAGAITVDIFFPLRTYIDEPTARQLRDRLREALQADARFADVRVYFG
ncbi:cation diffusion facilitator family transporter [Lamprobacter modestohalophilus]|uniref:cation diffusion facilitator family transporter n=1 Tax=Lamprobacter modestohalophilus TaxID=1064514 RepID=UPI002ADEEB0F|nr:cation diffusion facilitator family transporter [Lamprobacter modestohalophilus]MEA1052579.1 cation diffusion facilitator family transporter [Lamprobacter modestohalophilus]